MTPESPVSIALAEARVNPPSCLRGGATGRDSGSAKFGLPKGEVPMTQASAPDVATRRGPAMKEAEERSRVDTPGVRRCSVSA